MGTDKMDASTVYALFEELKQKIAELDSKTVPNVQADPVHPGEMTALVEELRTLTGQKQFTPEQIKMLQETAGQFAAWSLDKVGGKLEKVFAGISGLINSIHKKMDSLNLSHDSVIRKEHVFRIDIRSSKVAVMLFAMSLGMLLSLAGNIGQYRQNIFLKDNDLKYRSVKMQGGADRESLLKLETVFTYDRNRDSISVLRRQVETYERLVREQAEKTERARLNATEAERLQKEMETVKNRK
ncbi:MAG: hypothetical protein RBS55_09145 [Bacteroidales bacterium]|nr:hypothetical protein [Bacteroidales bacterium]